MNKTTTTTTTTTRLFLFCSFHKCMFFWPHLPSLELLWFGSLCDVLTLWVPPHFRGWPTKAPLKHSSPPPVTPGTRRSDRWHLEQTNNRGNLVTGTPIWSPQGHQTRFLHFSLLSFPFCTFNTKNSSYFCVARLYLFLVFSLSVPFFCKIIIESLCGEMALILQWWNWRKNYFLSI